MKVLSITPEQFDPDIHSLPTAGELLLPGMQVQIQEDGVAFEIKQTVIQSDTYGTVIELCKKGELVEVAVTGDRQKDGGYYFERLWVVTE